MKLISLTETFFFLHLFLCFCLIFMKTHSEYFLTLICSLTKKIILCSVSFDKIPLTEWCQNQPMKEVWVKGNQNQSSSNANIV